MSCQEVFQNREHPSKHIAQNIHYSSVAPGDAVARLGLDRLAFQQARSSFSGEAMCE